MINVDSTWNILPIHFISVGFWLMEVYVQGTLQMELDISWTLLLSQSALKQLLWEGLAAEFCQYLEQFA